MAEKLDNKKIAATLRGIADELDPTPRPHFALLSDSAAEEALRQHTWIVNARGVVQRLKAMNYVIVQMRNVDQ